MARRGRGAVTKSKKAELTATAKRTRAPWKRRGLTRAGRVLAFLESLPITKGHLRGKKMRLLPEQRQFIERVYVENAEVSVAILSTPKGNGKTGLSAGLCLCHLLGPEAIERGECYSAAIDRNQAAIIFQEMRAIIEAVPDFAARTNVLRQYKKIEVDDGDGKGSVYEALSSDVRRGHGLAPSFWVYDELGLCKTRELLSALEMGMGKQPRALGIIISVQAADDDHPLSELIDDGLEGLDPATYVQLHMAPDDADPYSEATWRAWSACDGGGGFNSPLQRERRSKSWKTSARRLARSPGSVAPSHRVDPSRCKPCTTPGKHGAKLRGATIRGPSRRSGAICGPSSLG
jgi:hypothetical protein